MAKPVGPHLDVKTWRLVVSEYSVCRLRECPLCCSVVTQDRVIEHLLWHRQVIKDEPTEE